MPVHPQVKTLLDGLAQAGGPALSEMTPVEARAMFKNLTAFDQPEEVTRVDDRVVPGRRERHPRPRVHAAATRSAVTPRCWSGSTVAGG